MTLHDGAVDVAKATAAGLAITFVLWVVKRWHAARRREQKLDRLLEIFEGTPADPMTNTPAKAGLVARIEAIETHITKEAAA